MKSYLNLLKAVKENGRERKDRTGIGTIGYFGAHFSHNMKDGFPLLTTKKIHTKSVIYELLWFLRGNTNIEWLNERGVTIWDEWADDKGNLGPVYGEQWVNWKGVRRNAAENRLEMTATNQIDILIKGLKENPFSRRHIVSAWNVSQVDDMKLPPCHVLWQCHVEDTSPKRTLNLHMYQRSADLFLGVPFNIASYAFLLHMIAGSTSMEPGKLIISFGDIHIYLNHLDQVNEQLSREPSELPKLILNPRLSIYDYEITDFVVTGYHPQPSIKAPIAV